MRENLKRARKEKGLTQPQTADLLGIGLRHYKAIESGERLGSIEIWDKIQQKSIRGFFVRFQKLITTKQIISRYI